MGELTEPSRRHRIQPAEYCFGPPCKRNVFQKGSEVDPLEIKSGPPLEWSLFDFFIVADLKPLFEVDDLTSNSCG